MEENSQSQPEHTADQNNKRLFKKYLLFFFVCALMAGSFFIGFKKGQGQSLSDERNVPLTQAIIENKLPSKDSGIDFALFWNVWDLLKQKHINKNNLNAQDMVYGAISGMLKATGDPYSSFFNPQESKAFSQDIEGSFEGIGAELGIKDNLLTVVAPLEGSPAQKSGIRAGDKILKVDDKVVADYSIDQAVELIRGKKGTQVKLTILHSGDQEAMEISITRDKIEVKSVKVEFKDGDIAHVKISKFSENTDKEFNEAVNQVLSNGSRGIVLDLRNDPGGLLEKAVNVASRMMPKGKVVVIEEDSQGKKENLRTSGNDKLSSIPTVILINEGSASASEILAGALKDNRGLALIGKKTFGKGSVQELIDLSGGSSVKITIAKWLTPNGDYIMEKGINPDIEVDLTTDDFENERDPQLDKAIEVLKEKMK